MDSWTNLGLAPERVAAVLQILDDVFAWKRGDSLRLRPEDKLWPIYHHYYPQQHWWQRMKAYELEVETLLRHLQTAVPTVTPSDLEADITLDELMRLFGP